MSSPTIVGTRETLDGRPIVSLFNLCTGLFGSSRHRSGGGMSHLSFLERRDADAKRSTEDRDPCAGSPLGCDALAPSTAAHPLTGRGCSSTACVFWFGSRRVGPHPVVGVSTMAPIAAVASSRLMYRNVMVFFLLMVCSRHLPRRDESVGSLIWSLDGSPASSTAPLQRRVVFMYQPASRFGWIGDWIRSLAMADGCGR